MLHWATGARNHGFLSSLSFTMFFFAVVDATAARPSRSKLSASCKTAFLAPGSVNCPATSRACSRDLFRGSSPRAGSAAPRAARDSSLEGGGFEPSVPVIIRGAPEDFAAEGEQAGCCP
jgi:hypothetical protein